MPFSFYVQVQSSTSQAGGAVWDGVVWRRVTWQKCVILSFCHFEAEGFVDFCTLWHFGSYFCSSEVLIKCIFFYKHHWGVHEKTILLVRDSTRFCWGRGRNRRGSRGASRVELCWAMNMFQSVWNILNIIMIDILTFLIQLKNIKDVVSVSCLSRKVWAMTGKLLRHATAPLQRTAP